MKSKKSSVCFMDCIICGRSVEKLVACTACWKKAVHGAARFFLKLEAYRRPQLYDEFEQKIRMKTLVNKYDRIIKRNLRRRERDMKLR